MNYKAATAVVSIATLIMPAGVALAKDNGQDSSENGLGVSEQIRANLNLNIHGDANDDDANLGAGASTSVEARQMGEDKRSENSPDTAGRGKSEDEHGTTTADTPSDDHGNGIVRGGIPAFFRWLFGLPATTTVGEIRTAVQATTTASTTSSSQGLGFFARLFAFLGFGQDN